MKGQPLISMREALAFFGNISKGKSWDPWRSVLIASRGEYLTKSEMKIFKKLSGRTAPHLQPHWRRKPESLAHHRG